ncbi:Gldg family protein [Solitalea lacus]|uniref:Gldg family protein n=1 Tax=Solitalea lacus TaxID=2911172 RepID=UPI001ED9E077|nr:Gldg family protein [Solitalea lacus]UKJ06760.1 Gldg family protein [Solitalea lacus]
MKKIIRIARIELSTMFYSPIAWLILIIFVIQCGIRYAEIMEAYVSAQITNGSSTHSLTSGIFSFGRTAEGLFSYMAGKLYFYLPLLTMGLMSRETSSGTIKLLYSSPLKIRDIILGKFTAMAIFSFVLVFILACFGATAIATIPFADYGQILSGLLGIFLLLCAYSAIGLFMSCLTNHQIVAATGTFVVFAMLGYIDKIGQNLDFVRELTYYLSFTGRAASMIGGMVMTNDILYFLLIISLFLCFSYFKLLATRESKPVVVRVGRYIGAFVIVITMTYVSSRPTLIGYFDTTRNDRNTLSLNGQAIIGKMKEGTVEVTSYINLNDAYFGVGHPSERMRDLGRWQNYIRFKPDIKLNYVYYYDTTFGAYSRFKYEPKGTTIKAFAEKNARANKVNLSDFKTPEEIRKVIDLRSEENRYVMQIKCDGKSTFLRIYDDMQTFPSETETLAALKRLGEDKFPKVGFLQGQQERSSDNREGDKEYGYLTSKGSFRHSLINQGFDVETVSSNQKIPSYISVLVIADPRVSFSSQALENIREYIDRGGNLLIAGEPGKQEVLNPVLKPLGVELTDGLLVQPGTNLAPELILADFTKNAIKFSNTIAKSVYDSAKVIMNGATGLRYKEGIFTIEPLLTTNIKKGWLKKAELDKDIQLTASIGNSVNEPQGKNDVAFVATDGDEKGSFPTALALSRKINGKEQRIMVSSDADFMSNSEVSNVRKLDGAITNNFGFALATFGWLSQGEYPIDTSIPGSKDTKLNLTDNGLSIVKLIWIYLLPGALLSFGSVLLIRRRNK